MKFEYHVQVNGSVSMVTSNSFSHNVSVLHGNAYGKLPFCLRAEISYGDHRVINC